MAWFASTCLVACSSGSDEGVSPDASGGAETAGAETGGSATGGSEAGGAANAGNGNVASPTGGRTAGASGGSAGGTPGEGSGGTTGGAPATPELPPTNVPVIDSLFAAINDEGAVGIEFEGRSGPSPSQMVELQFLDAAGESLSSAGGWGEWLLRPNRFLERGGAGQVVVDGNRFFGFLSALDLSLTERPERVRVTVRDRALNRSEPVEAELVPASPQPRAEGEVCDALGVLSECQGAALCDVRNGGGPVVAPTCQVPAETCPLDLPVLEDVFEGSNEALPDETDASCTFSRGLVGSEQGHAFTAPRAGSYRFTAVSVDYQAAITLFVRSICDFGRAGDSELACTHMNDAGEDEPLVVELDLDAGQTVFVYVEANWFAGGEYTLSVEALD